LATPADGYRSPSDGSAVWEGQTYSGVSGPRPVGIQPRPGVAVGAGGAASAAAAPAAPVPTPGFKL
jgi:hypothetical protein